MLKNGCFQIMMLEKTLESLLDSKEIKPVNPKGNIKVGAKLHLFTMGITNGSRDVY